MNRRPQGIVPPWRAGIAAVELAICLPLLIGFLLGLWEVGRMIQVQQIMTNAAREGGRQASTGTRTTADVQKTVTTYLEQYGIPTAKLTIKVVNLTDGSRSDPTKANQLDQFQITASIPFNEVRWILLNQITPMTTLTATADWYCMRDTPLVLDADIPLN